VTLFDDADELLHDALVVSALAKTPDGGPLSPGEAFVGVFTVENTGVGDKVATQGRTVFLGVTLRVEATPFATPWVDGEARREVVFDIGELIYGEARTIEVLMRATAAIDGPEVFARAHLQGRLDVQRFFALGTVHAFTTDIRRPQADDPAADAFLHAATARGLAPGLAAKRWSFSFDDETSFLEVANDPDRFRGFVRERCVEIAEARGVAGAAVSAGTRAMLEQHVEVHPTGFTGSLAFALWWVGFDQGESSDFGQLAELARAYLTSEPFENRRELRIFKGFDNDGVLADPWTVPDLPVVVDYGARIVTLWAASLEE
jgi:hypothetical protein